MKRFCLVRLTVPDLPPLTYAALPETCLGLPVLAPLRGRLIPGVVVNEDAPAPAGFAAKSLNPARPFPPLSPAFLRFLEKSASYYWADISKTLEAALPNEEELTLKTRKRILYRLPTPPDAATAPPPPPDLLSALFPPRPAPVRKRKAEPPLTKQRACVLAALAEGKALPKEELNATASLLAAMVKDGQITAEMIMETCEEPLPDLPPPRPNLPKLSEEQARAAKALLPGPGEPPFKMTLLRGMTGSGKTEVFFQAAADMLARDPEGQALFLAPEIALTSQMQARAEARFGVPPVLWHSALPPAVRRRNRLAICSGNAKIILGARSAVFLPFPRLRLAVLDEEHETSYKQEEGLRYHARDALALRAKEEGFAVVLASATPSLETARLAREGKYTQVRLSARHGAAKPPAFHLVDMRKTPPSPGEWISSPLANALRECFARGKQALLFLNRRGYAPVVMCKRCGYAHECDACSSRMTFHRAAEKLVCHSCGKERPLPTICPQCASEDPPALSGPGVERLLEEARRRFPEASATALSADDSAAGTIAEALAKVQSGETNLLIGTQIVAKGLDFPNLILTGVVDADAGLRGCDPRAGERAFQLIRQAAGRAGRGDTPGAVYLQTYQPESPFFRLLRSADEEAFEREELHNRRECSNPPFTRLTQLTFASEDEHAARTAAAEAALHLSSALTEDAALLGPAPPPVAKRRGKYLFRIILRSADVKSMRATLAKGLAQTTLPRDVDLSVDVDPLSL